MTGIYGEDAELYDIAFDWDIEGEADWLVARLGRECRDVLEPGCGTGRMLEALARRGLEVVGIDSSEHMVEYARRRLAAAGVEGEVVLADMADFDLGRRFGGAVCPINTLGHLAPDDVDRHFALMAQHLGRGARYLVQVGLPLDADELWRSEWVAERGETRVEIVWEALGRDRASGRELARSRLEVVSGPRSGEVVEDEHVMTVWTAATWRETVARSPFTQVACYDGNLPGRPQVEPEQGGGLLWHELVAA